MPLFDLSNDAWAEIVAAGNPNGQEVTVQFGIAKLRIGSGDRVFRIGGNEARSAIAPAGASVFARPDGPRVLISTGDVTGADTDAPSAQSATTIGATSGPVFTYQRLLGSSSTIALVAGSNANLTLNATSGVLSATAALGVGVAQTATVRESLAGVAIEVPITITGVSATPTPTPTPTTFVSTLNVINFSKDAETTRPGRLQRWPHVLPKDTLEVKFAWANWYLPSASSGPVTNGADLPFVSMIAETNGQKVTLNIGGNASPTVLAGTNSDFTQTLTPAMFGLTGGVFPAGTIIWTATNIMLASATDALPVGLRRSTDLAGAYAGVYNPGITTITNDGFGGFTTSGTNASPQTGYGFAPYCVGRLAAASNVWMAIGDSITAYKNDDLSVAPAPTGMGQTTVGWFNRSIAALGVPGANFGISTSKTLAGSSASVLSYWFQFANRAMLGYAGTNSFAAGTNAATVRTEVMSRQAQLRASGAITKVISYQTLNYTTGDYTSEPGQTPQTLYEAGGQVDQYRQQMGTMGFDAVLPFAMTHGANYNVWPANGTTDGLHPGPALILSMRDAAVAVMAGQ